MSNLNRDLMDFAEMCLEKSEQELDEMANEIVSEKFEKIRRKKPTKREVENETPEK